MCPWGDLLKEKKLRGEKEFTKKKFLCFLVWSLHSVIVEMLQGSITFFSRLFWGLFSPFWNLLKFNLMNSVTKQSLSPCAAAQPLAGSCASAGPGWCWEQRPYQRQRRQGVKPHCGLLSWPLVLRNDSSDLLDVVVWWDRTSPSFCENGEWFIREGVTFPFL